MTDLFGSDVDDSEEEENVGEDKMSEGENIKEHSGGSEHSEQEDDNDDEEPEGEEEEEEEDGGEEEKEKEEDSDERSNEDEDEEEQETDKMEGPEGHVDKDEEVIMCYIYTGSLSFCMLIYIICMCQICGAQTRLLRGRPIAQMLTVPCQICQRGA